METYMYVMKKIACEDNSTCYGANSTMDGYQTMYGLQVLHRNRLIVKDRMILFKNITDTATLSTKTKKLLKLEISQYDFTSSLMTIDEMVQSCSFNTEKCDMDM